MHVGVPEAADMKVTAYEAVAAMSSRAAASDISPSMMVFVQKSKLYGELYKGGQTHSFHPSGGTIHNELWRGDFRDIQS